MLAAARWSQRFLLAIGFVILGYCGAALIYSRIAQFRGNRELDLLRVERPASNPYDVRVPQGSPIGKVEIENLRLSAVVFQGTDDSILDRGVGHVEDSALPGQSGNVVLAAHRDTFFRGLRKIAKGDIVKMTTPSGVRSYAVESTRIVDPDQTSVMDPTPVPALTLITCYPFYYVGHAPKRFIVRAVESDPERENTANQLIAGNSKAARVISGRSDDRKDNLTYLFKASQ